jgi:hypothetical protein
MTLHLNLKKKWFDMIASGEKKEEYRELKPYWVKRLMIDVEVKDPTLGYEKLFDLILRGSEDVSYGFVRFIDVSARNGYRKNSPKLKWINEGITIGYGNPEWGAEKGKAYFKLKIGRIIYGTE